MKFFALTLFLSIFLWAHGSIEPITPINGLNPAKVFLGKKLFFDARLSADNTVACASCHILSEGGDDGLKYSVGIQGRRGNINAPTVLNAANNFRQYWDGRAKSLQEQVAGPIENPVEMGNTFQKIIKKLSETEYKTLFSAIYKQGICKESIADAIAEYEKTLLTLNAPFDKYLLGDKDAITKEQKEGFELFEHKGCISCHNGVNVGGNLYSKFGVIESASTDNLGRFNITDKARDKYYFKVPSLRNIALTAPYFHDGRAATLQEAIQTMSQLQLGRQITKQEIHKIKAFLESLTGELPKAKDIYVP